MSSIQNYLQLLKEIEQTAINCRRAPQDMSLVAVTKSVEWPQIIPIYAEGQRLFGESRLTEAVAKQASAPNDCQWHFIGTLQKNKVRKVIEKFALIHSVDSLALAQRISECSREFNITTHILLQANTSGESSKHGATPDMWKADFEDLIALPNLSIDGLMTMAPLTEDENAIRQCFAGLRDLRTELNLLANGRAHLKHLSMGMTHDFKIAIAEGATLLRIGSAIFAN